MPGKSKSLVARNVDPCPDKIPIGALDGADRSGEYNKVAKRDLVPRGSKLFLIEMNNKNPSKSMEIRGDFWPLLLWIALLVGVSAHHSDQSSA